MTDYVDLDCCHLLDADFSQTADIEFHQDTDLPKMAKCLPQIINLLFKLFSNVTGHILFILKVLGGD